MTVFKKQIEKLSGARARAAQFIQAENGTATIEFVLWFPVVFLIFGLVVNVTMIFYHQNEVLRTVQDANRSLSIGRLDDVDETQDYIEEQLATMLPNATAVSRISSGVVRTIVTYPASDLLWFNLFGSLNGLMLTTHADHLIEDYEEA